MTDWNTMMAFSVLASLPLVVAFVFLQRFMVRGHDGGRAHVLSDHQEWKDAQ